MTRRAVYRAPRLSDYLTFSISGWSGNGRQRPKAYRLDPRAGISVFTGPRGFNLARFKRWCAHHVQHRVYLPLSLVVSRSFDVYSRGGRARESNRPLGHERHLRRIIQSSRRPKKRANGPEPINAFDNGRLGNRWGKERKGPFLQRVGSASIATIPSIGRRSPPLIKARLVSSISVHGSRVPSSV